MMEQFSGCIGSRYGYVMKLFTNSYIKLEQLYLVTILT